MLEICIQTSYDQNVQLILKSYLPVVLGTTLNDTKLIVQCWVYKPEKTVFTDINIYYTFIF
jgi:hypothetical protein